MGSEMAKKAGLALFTKHIAQYEPADPLYETYTDKKGRVKRRKRELPPGLSQRDAKILKKVKSRAHHLDKGFRICGMRFGWTFVIGLVPVVGDVSDALLNYTLVVKKAKQANIPDWLLRRMLLNNAISAGVGFVPLVGDVILASFKANSRNGSFGGIPSYTWGGAFEGICSKCSSGARRCAGRNILCDVSTVTLHLERRAAVLH